MKILSCEYITRVTIANMADPSRGRPTFRSHFKVIQKFYLNNSLFVLSKILSSKKNERRRRRMRKMED